MCFKAGRNAAFVNPSSSLEQLSKPKLLFFPRRYRSYGGITVHAPERGVRRVAVEFGKWVLMEADSKQTLQ